MEGFVQRLIGGIDTFPLLAIPFFILAGNLMNTGGITDRLVRFARALVGHIRGGLAHVVVVTNMIMAGMSGSGVADAAGSGTILIPAMRKAGYGVPFAASIVAAAGTIGPIIPPSIPFVLYGSIASVSIGRLLLGGAIPGVLMGICLMVFIYVIARQRHYPSEARASWKEMLSALLYALPPLGMPTIILGGIIGGIMTPTESAAAGAAYAFILGHFVYRELTLAQIPGYAAAAFLIEAWGRRQTLVTFLAGSAVSALLFGWAVSQTPLSAALVLTAGCALSFFNLGAWGALYAIGPEVYPTTIRGTGTGAAAAFGRIAAMLAPLSVPYLIALGGRELTFGVFTASFVLAAVGATFLPDLRNKRLEEA